MLEIGDEAIFVKAPNTIEKCCQTTLSKILSYGCLFFGIFEFLSFIATVFF